MMMVSLAVGQALAQADYARERRWADEIAPAVVVGDPVELELKSRRKFLAIYTPGSESRRRRHRRARTRGSSGLGPDRDA
jgi:hypothetical protein